MGPVLSVAFSPDGTRVATGSTDKTARVWNARTGAFLFELNGNPREVASVWFSPDPGASGRIVTGSDDETAKVWDARTGRELTGEPIPPAPWPAPISPDGRLIAHPVGNRVDLIPLQPDAEERAYRLLLTRPNIARIRTGYDAARAANDQFAARFYYDRLPPPERTRVRAEAIVAPLFAQLLLRVDVLAALKSQPAHEPLIQAACVKLAGIWPESAVECNNAAFAQVRAPGQPAAAYERGLRLARTACRLEPYNGFFLNTLGVAQYRSGLVEDALVTLTRSNASNKETEPADLAFLALAQHRLGQVQQARHSLSRLRELMKKPQSIDDHETEGFLHEAETIELDQLFPPDPFAR
jgi:hypothetical protein